MMIMQTQKEKTETNNEIMQRKICSYRQMEEHTPENAKKQFRKPAFGGMVK